MCVLANVLYYSLLYLGRPIKRFIIQQWQLQDLTLRAGRGRDFVKGEGVEKSLKGFSCHGYSIIIVICVWLIFL